MRALAPITLVAALLVLLAPAPAAASRPAQFGIQDDAWLASGAGTLDSRLDTLERMGVDVVRYTLRWDAVGARRPARPATHTDRAYSWQTADAVLRGLRVRGIAAVVTLYGTPRWANRGRAPNRAPTSNASLAAFANAAQTRYPFVQKWLIWNEPNQRRFFQPTTPAAYTRMLNPAYAALKRRNPRAQVGAGVTAPRGGRGGVSPVRWIRGMKAARARFDAYAHHPHPLNPRFETPWTGGCRACETITMANLERLLGEVQRNFGAKRIWLTEYGYQTNPPDRMLGVSPALQARYMGEAALRAYLAPRVDMLIHFLVRDEPTLGRWQSGVFTVRGAAKPSYRAFALPLAQSSRTATRTVLWGQVRPRRGIQTYRLQQFVGGSWRWVGGTARTDRPGVYARTVRAGKGARFRVWSPKDKLYSPVLVVR